MPRAETIHFGVLSLLQRRENDRRPGRPRPIACCGALTDDYEIIVVNDGSRDESAAVLAALATQRRRGCASCTHRTNRGYGAALRSGFEHATKDLVFYTDGDGQYDVSEIPILLMLLTDDTHFVNGMKMTRQDPPHRVFIGNLHRFVTRWCSGCRSATWTATSA